MGYQRLLVYKQSYIKVILNENNVLSDCLWIKRVRINLQIHERLMWLQMKMKCNSFIICTQL